MASNIENWLPESGKPNFTMIICIMSIINFLSATQDIVVDGWALTMLKKSVSKLFTKKMYYTIFYQVHYFFIFFKK